MEAWTDQPSKRDNRQSLTRCTRGLFSQEVLSNSEQAKHDLSYPERSILKLLPRYCWVLTIDYCFGWQWNDKSKFFGRQKLAAILIFAVSLISVLFSPNNSVTPSLFSSYWYFIRGVAVASITTYKHVTNVLVVMSLIAWRRVTCDIKVCPC